MTLARKYILPFNKEKKLGFTLVEMIIVLFIIVIITTLILLNYRQSQRRIVLENTAQQVELNLRRVQNLSLQAAQYQGIVPERYGAYFASPPTSTYILFADCSGGATAQKYDPAGFPCNGAPEKMEAISLPANISISQTSAYIATSPIHITFRPPDPETTIIQEGYEPSGSASKAQIVIRDDISNIFRVIIVRKTGSIEIGSPEPTSPPPLDQVSPSVWITSPSDGAIVTSTITILATATDNIGGSGVKYVTFFYDDISIGTDNTVTFPDSYSMLWNTTAVLDGFYDLKARAFDNAGNLRDSSLVGVKVDNVPEIGPNKYAWSENIGWIDFCPGGIAPNGETGCVTVGATELTGWAKVLSTGGWISFKGANYGVTNNSGNLSGWAWSEDFGWISFWCEDPTPGVCPNYYRVTIDGSGVFHGWAWSDNIGWISVNCNNPEADTCPPNDYWVALE